MLSRTIRAAGYRRESLAYPATLLFTLSLTLFTCVPAMARADADSDKSSELQSIRTEIKQVETNIRSARDESDKIFKELQVNESKSATISTRLRDIDAEINTKVVRLAELKVAQADNENSLKSEKEYLSRQIRAAYRTGQNDYLKLLLNLEDPALVGRMLAYYDYFNKSRTMRIQTVSHSLTQITSLKETIQTETEQLEQLRADQLARLEEFTKHRNSRKKIINRLEGYIEEQDRQLQVLQNNERELTGLVEELKQQKTEVQMFTSMPSLAGLKGKLKWPVTGKLLSRFGSSRKGDKLKWQGVSIDAPGGAEVRAISSGKVVFADWFRNQGLLIILDHGNGYMSLYGHNERLLKKEGDIVSTGESIAVVGDTGGQQHPNLYFEIRKDGNPQNPGLWCKE